MKYDWTCQCRGRTFDSLPMDYAVKAPRNWFGITIERVKQIAASAGPH
jgi:hypothetical protein